MRQPAIIHPNRNIGDTVALLPAQVVGDRGPLREIIRTEGGDDSAQLLTVTLMGSGVFDSSLSSTPANPSAPIDPRGPLFATIEWGVKGTRSAVEIDLPQGGVVFSLVASYLRVSARYDGLVTVNGAQLDPAASGGHSPGPEQRAGAMVGYGSYGCSCRLTRTFRFSDVPLPSSDPDAPPPRTELVRVPSFGRRVLASGLGIQAAGRRIRVVSYDRNTVLEDAVFAPGDPPRFVTLPGDAAFVALENLGPRVLVTPALVFEIAI